MPLYEYFCSDCHNRFEALRPANQADAMIECERCQGLHTLRVLSVFAAVSNGQAMPGTSGGCGCGGGGCGCGHGH